MKPRIFVSCVTAELGTTRQLVANVLLRLGYDPVLQDIFGTEPGDLRQMLRDKIDDCDGLIQIVGRAYGAEPPSVDAQFGRVSYTQFEFLYAQSRGKKTWLIFADEGCTHDRPLEQLDLPRDPAHPDPAAYQAERRALQEARRERWREHTHLWHGAGNDTELELKIERLKDEFAQLRRAFRSWQRNVTRNLAVVALLLMIVGGGVWWTVLRQPHEVKQVVKETIAEQLAELQPDRIREQLRKEIEATYQRDLTQAESLKDWQKRADARKAAADTRDRRTSQLDEFLQSITATIQSGDASPEFLELTRIVREQGVEAALAYVTSQQSRLLDRAASLVAQQQRELRRTLAPLLEGVRLHRTRGKLSEALDLCEKLLAADAHWPEALHEHFWAQIELGDRALRYETLSSSVVRFRSAHAAAEQLIQLDGNNPLWQRDLSVSYNRLGDVQRQSGQVTEALAQYQKGLEIRQKLAAADPSNAQAQRDLSVSYNRLGDVQRQSGQVTEALAQYQKGLEISQKLAAADPSDAQAQNDLSISIERIGDVSLQLGKLPDARDYFERKKQIDEQLVNLDPSNAKFQRDLSISYEKLGNVLLQSGQVTEALGMYQKALEISQKLAAADPSNAQVQRDLSVSYNQLGNVLLQSGQVTEALEQYQRDLEISQKLAAADPIDAQAQRDLSVSYNHLGNVLLQSGQVTEALGMYQKGLEIRQKLVAADPSDAQAQRDVYVSYDKLGDVQLQSGQATEALGSYQKCLEISQKLAAADPSNAQAQRDLSVSYNQLGNVLLQSGQVTEALEQYQKDLEISQKLAAADPSDAQAQRDLSVSYNHLGNVLLQSGEVTEALGMYQKGLEIRQKLAAADPSDAQAQFDLYISNAKLGEVNQRSNRFVEAITWYERALELLQGLERTKRLAPSQKPQIGVIESRLQQCRLSSTAMGDWTMLLQQPVALLPALLDIRGQRFIQDGRIGDAVQSVAKLRELGTATAGQLYNAACVYSLCAAAIKPETDQLTTQQATERQQHIADALETLRAAIKAGWKDFAHIQKDPDLTVLRDLPEFQALLPKP